MRKRLLVFLGIVLAAFMLAGCGKKEYKVTFDVAGGTPAMVDAQTIKKDGLVTEPTAPTREG